MTILEASNKLLEFFAENDYFQLDKHFNKVCLLSDTDADKAAVMLALEELAKQNFVSKKDMSGQEFWILVKPLSLNTLELSLSVITALSAASVINRYIKKEEDKANPLQLSEKDIVNLILIAQRT